MESQSIKSSDTTAKLFTRLPLRNIELPNRFVRSATYEGLGDAWGNPREELGKLYADLTAGGVGTIITGFVYISQQGRAMQPHQCGIDKNESISRWRKIVAAAKKPAPDTKIILQIAHAGRQTLSKITALPVVGASGKACTYFRQLTHMLEDKEVQQVIQDFAQAAYRAKMSGFDGVQLHAAHGYLIHQFLSPHTNIRYDRWKDRPLFLEELIKAIRSKCGDSYPILVKLSAAEDAPTGISVSDTIDTVRRLEALDIDAVEISYGTMEYALNVIRGAVPMDAILKVNPMIKNLPGFVKLLIKKFYAPSYTKRFIPFTEDYNIINTSLIWSETQLPVFAVGGIRTVESMAGIVNDLNIDAVALSRPLICEPDLPNRIRQGTSVRSRCVNCNLCAVYCDSTEPLQCRLKMQQKK